AGACTQTSDGILAVLALRASLVHFFEFCRLVTGKEFIDNGNSFSLAVNHLIIHDTDLNRVIHMLAKCCGITGPDGCKNITHLSTCSQADKEGGQYDQEGTFHF